MGKVDDLWGDVDGKLACERLGKRLAQWVAFYCDGRNEAYPGPISLRN